MADYSVLLEDLNMILAETNIPWSLFQGSTVLVTGSTGTIGSAIIRVFAELNARNRYSITIIAAGRNQAKGDALEQFDGVRFLRKDIREPFDINDKIDYIFHCAAVTRSSQMVSDPVGVIETEVLGARNVLELARGNRIKGMVYTSSMEVYGFLDKDDVLEDDQGYIDLSSVRSCYPQSKRIVEAMCNCYAKQYGLPISIVRLGMTFGASCDINDTRVWAQFAHSAVDKKDIILRTEGKSVSSLLYLADAVTALVTVMLSGGGTYNAAAASMSIRDIAQTVAAANGIKAIVDIDDAVKLGYSADFKLPLNTDKLKALGWRPRVAEVDSMFERLVGDWKVQIDMPICANEGNGIDNE